MLHRLQVEGYKSLDGVDVVLDPLTVVFGPNAAGKSNLLDAIGLLSRMATSPNLDAAFASHRGTPLEAFLFPEDGLQGLQRQERATFRFTADVRLDDSVVEAVEAEIRRAREGLAEGTTSRRRSVTERFLRYSVQIEIRTGSGHLRVIDERLEALRGDWSPSAARRPFLERMPERTRIRLRMEKQGHPTYEEIGQDRTIVSKPLYPPHYPHITALREELSRWRVYFLDPAAMREEVPLKEVETLAPNGADLAAFFNTLRVRNPAQLQALEKTLHQMLPSIRGLEIERTAQGFLTLTVHEDQMPLSSRLVSEGTLRVLGLLAITNPPRPMAVVGYEEPENGVNPARLSVVAELLANAARRGTTQFIVNTHSPVLPEYFEGKPGAVLLHCYKEGRRTRFKRFAEAGAAERRNGIRAVLEDRPSGFRDRVVRGDFGR